MSVQSGAPAGGSAVPAKEHLSVLDRAVAVFARPTQAWVGISERSQVWFPILISTLLSMAFVVVLYQRAFVPAYHSQYGAMVEAGRMSAEQAEHAEEVMSGPLGILFVLVPATVFPPIMLLLIALVMWFGVGFVLGGKFSYGQALAVTAWSSLVHIPATILTAVLAWTRESIQGIHIGLGVLVSESDPPTKLQGALAGALDAFGPFYVWSLVVAILGASILSGAPRRSVTWVLSGLYVALVVFFAALAAVFGPSA